MSEAPGSRAGSTFGPYHLKRLLGRGGMGEVYEAEHSVKGWTVAVKLMSETVSSDPVFRERMKREARIAGRLKEPHVVPIHDYGEIDGQMFLEMRLIEGTDLDSLLTRYGPLPAPRAVAVITQIASALDAAHAAGVMHRDVKPPNILVTRKDFAYLVDFGIASATTDEKITQLGTAVGTWKYMAPERFSSDDITHRADIYALACVLFECLTGSAPYPSDNAGVLISAHMINPIPRPSAAGPDVPRSLDAVVARGMAKRPADRYGSAGELARAAHQALSHPDQENAAAIVRRSQESAIPEGLLNPPPAQRFSPPGPVAPVRPPAPLLAGPPGPLNPPAPAPASTGPWHPTNPPAPPPGRSPWAIVALVAAVILVVMLGGIGIWALNKDDDKPQTSAKRTTTTRATTSTSTRTTTAPSTTAPPQAQTRLMSLLPAGYPAGACTPDTKTMPGALVSVSCGQNTDPNGPKVSAYGLFPDVASLKSAFTAFTGTFSLQQCPGGKASPGNWWHTQDPKTVLGQMACGIYKGSDPQVMWSNEQTLVYALVGGKQQVPSLDQLYKWWAKHS
ncbi:MULTISPECIES: serine/threonine-protein kinase [unclassified Mycobacterium]|uniref:serine/threonine-protein kinase n=1 Tax=unclassified Mycobacterium TaxID=2642494 RepID=UPI0027418C14|nr:MULTISPECIES: serine/threonine-protein kinase [unclassified Mycobacterium]MDP7705434.1 serine/threonine-protein kinase [Mycobacterium sp. TY815]MDP7724879.1 serine/threonine-protein kinase [Mycobacterium sp. TY814]